MMEQRLSSICEDTNLKAIHNCVVQQQSFSWLSSICEDTNLKAIHNRLHPWIYRPDRVPGQFLVHVGQPCGVLPAVQLSHDHNPLKVVTEGITPS